MLLTSALALYIRLCVNRYLEKLGQCEPRALSSPDTIRLDDLLQPPHVYPDVIRELGVETRAHDVALPDGDDVVHFAPLHLGRGLERAALDPLGPVGQYTEDLDGTGYRSSRFSLVVVVVEWW